jgi:hypothetical protein
MLINKSPMDVIEFAQPVKSRMGKPAASAAPTKAGTDGRRQPNRIR